DPPHHCLSERMDPGELPALLRARLAEYAREPHRAARWLHRGPRRTGLRHANQARSLEPPRRRPAGQRTVAMRKLIMTATATAATQPLTPATSVEIRSIAAHD